MGVRADQRGTQAWLHLHGLPPLHSCRMEYLAASVLWLSVLAALLALSSGDAAAPEEARGRFSPRVDYDEWTPLGRGDPLKNDPTYDYVPPVLDRVHYWAHPSSRTQTPAAPLERRTPASPPASRKDVFEPFLKFVERPKFGRPPQRHFPRPQYETSVSAPEPQVIQHLQTVLLPPPAPPAVEVQVIRHLQTVLPPPPAPPAVEVQRAELAYLSPGTWQPSSRVPVTATPAPPALTTDPLFAHYKQPSEPLRGPMYLIIQGHSRVKKYGSRAGYHGIPIREDNHLRPERPGETVGSAASHARRSLGSSRHSRSGGQVIE
ncbi:amyloid beta A4 precursor protein-binding family B member 1-interacting protein [Bacillus rossius redtenbacheri]|uniref:amyloid beta A4 precursor protein-binding family B member 1-interacting protein n=1 Tax=Bacillus rossius redtenbacheri TaxID=93214 RepID=UPI002FDD298D